MVTATKREDEQPRLVPLVPSEDLRAWTAGPALPLVGRPAGEPWDGEGLAPDGAGWIVVAYERGPLVERYDGGGHYRGTLSVPGCYAHLTRPNLGLEGLAVSPSGRSLFLANEAALPNINLLHLSSRKAVQAAMTMSEVFPHIDFKREVTIGHLMLDITSKAAELAKVNPPIRPREDVEFMWEALLAGELDWVVSDHACCRHETKIPKRYFGNIWMAKSGFGGTEYLLPALVSEGMKRGMGLNHMARVTSWNPAQRYGLNHKGDIAEGFDADLALVDPGRTWTIAAKDSPSTQGYTPFEGLELSARVDATFLRGMKIYEDGQVRILDNVRFKTGSAQIDPESYSLLDQVALTLKANSQIKRIRVEGHSDDTGGREMNIRLSKARAQSVKQYLIKKGVSADRLTSEGYGPDKPLVSGSDEAARAKNRRVEFVIDE